MDGDNLEPIIIFTGFRNFETTKASAQLMIVDHEHCNCVEIVAFEKAEAPRLYLSSAVLYAQIDQADVLKLAETRRNNQNERKKSRRDGEQEETRCLHDLAVQYIFFRLNFRLVGGKPVISFHALPDDPPSVGLVCQKPSSLHPTVFVPRKLSESAAVFSKAVGAVKHEGDALDQVSSSLMELSAQLASSVDALNLAVQNDILQTFQPAAMEQALQEIVDEAAKHPRKGGRHFTMDGLQKHWDKEKESHEKGAKGAVGSSNSGASGSGVGGGLHSITTASPAVDHHDTNRNHHSSSATTTAAAPAATAVTATATAAAIHPHSNSVSHTSTTARSSEASHDHPVHGAGGGGGGGGGFPGGITTSSSTSSNSGNSNNNNRPMSSSGGGAVKLAPIRPISGSRSPAAQKIPEPHPKATHQLQPLEHIPTLPAIDQDHHGKH